jgi:hypothetical protein
MTTADQVIELDAGLVVRGSPVSESKEYKEFRSS